MAETKRMTPLGLIGSITTLAAFVGVIFAVDARYMTRAEAADKTAEVLQQQQMDRVETDLALIDLEINFLQEKVERQRQVRAPSNQSRTPQVIDDEASRKIHYLEQRRMILENYRLELQSRD